MDAFIKYNIIYIDNLLLTRDLDTIYIPRAIANQKVNIGPRLQFLKLQNIIDKRISFIAINLYIKESWLNLI